MLNIDLLNMILMGTWGDRRGQINGVGSVGVCERPQDHLPQWESVDNA